MPPSLCPRFGEEKQESALETKDSMGTVAPVSLCLWLLLLLGGLCPPFWPQVLLPPSLKQPRTFFWHSVFQAVKWRQRCCRFILADLWHCLSESRRLSMQRLFVIFSCTGALVNCENKPHCSCKVDSSVKVITLNTIKPNVSGFVQVTHETGFLKIPNRGTKLGLLRAIYEDSCAKVEKCKLIWFCLLQMNRLHFLQTVWE